MIQRPTMDSTLAQILDTLVQYQMLNTALAKENADLKAEAAKQKETPSDTP